MPYLLNGPLTMIFVIVGTCLNALTVYVLSKHNFVRQVSCRIRSRKSVRRSDSTSSGYAGKPRIYIYLMWLSFIDITLLISAMLMYSLPAIMGGSMGAYIHFFPVYYLLSNTALTASVWLMCALMIDRYRSLCSPLTARQLSFSSIHRILFLTCVAALSFSVPRFFEIELYQDEDNQYFLRQTNLVHNQIYMIGYRIIGGLMFYSLLPYVLLFAMSSRVMFVLRAAAKARLKMAAQQNVSGCTDSEMILLYVMAKFLCSRLMPTALDVAEHAVGADKFLESPEATMCVDISNLLVVASSSTNFVIFYVFSNSFRQKLWKQNNLTDLRYQQSIRQPKLVTMPSVRRPPARNRPLAQSTRVPRTRRKPSTAMKTTSLDSAKLSQSLECVCYDI
uniref:G_PROTEIN_RECEP_F1_2 domain-containing protein n=1 Tax=Panagrellus redivivus TaxID=6233 RepID=A0A7E4V269_PANRE